MKIGQKLILAFVGITLCVGVLIGYISTRVSERALRENIEKAPLVYNDIIIRSLDVFLYNRLSDFKDLASGYMVESTIASSNQLFSKVEDIKQYMEERQAAWTGIPKKEPIPGAATDEKPEAKEATPPAEAKELKAQEKQELKAELKEELKKEVAKELKQELKAAVKAEVKKEAVAAQAQVEETKEKVSSVVAEVMDNWQSKRLMGLAKQYEKTYEIENFGQILVTNKYGACVAAARKSANYSHDTEKWWQATKEEGVYIGEVEYNETAGIYELTFGFRIEDKEGKFAGAMLVRPNIKIINRDIKDQIAETYKQVDLKLLDIQGRVIYATGDGVELLKEFSRYKDIQDNQQKSGSFLARDAEGNAKIFVYARTRSYAGFKGLGWVCVAELSAGELLGPVEVLRNTIMGISAVVILMALLIGFLVARSISVPIRKLTVAMTEISKGNFEIELPAKTIALKDEIGDLAKSFSRMVAALKFFKEEGEGDEERGEGE